MTSMRWGRGLVFGVLLPVSGCGLTVADTLANAYAAELVRTAFVFARVALFGTA